MKRFKGFLSKIARTFKKNYFLRGLRIVYGKGHISAYIDDYPHFDNRKIEAAPPQARQQAWVLAHEYNKIDPTENLKCLHRKLKTVAFLIIKDDEIWHEYYARGYGKEAKTNSYSMAKSITVALLGKALMEGAIKSLEQPVADFFPHFDQRLTVGDLASMASGLEWEENRFNPFSTLAKIYLDENIRKLMLNCRVTEPPGKAFKYLSGNTQLLGMIIEKATGANLSDYLSKHFWQPMGMQHDALWQLDSIESGMEKAYCCIASNARDFARFGKLFKAGGTWQGRQLLDREFVEKCLRPRFASSPQYGYGFWLSQYRDKSIFVMRGILGQYVITIPEDDLIIVRLGKKRYKDFEKNFPKDFYNYIDEAYQMLSLAD